MKRSGSADLPLHYGYVPMWLAERMSRLGLAITEAILTEYGKAEVLRRLSDPFWFQSLGAVMGMDWHSSGITTAVMGALKRAINPHSKELGIYICGGKGKSSRQAPNELMHVGERTGLDGNYLVRCSKLSAIATLQTAVHKAKIGQGEKQQAIKKLSEIARKAEKGFTPNTDLDKVIEKERNESWRYGGRTVFGKAKPPDAGNQLKLF